MRNILIAWCVAGFLPLAAETVRVTVGDTGCPGRQLAVKRLWEKIPEVLSVTVLAKAHEGPAASRVFIVVSQGPSPDFTALQNALGRRAERYPILAYRPEPQKPQN